MKEKSTFALRLTARRIELKHTQESFAKIVGMSRARYANYEQSRREPDFETAKLFAENLNTTTDYLLGKKPTDEEVQDIEKIFKSLPLDQQKAFVKKLFDSFMDWQQDRHK